MKSRGHRVAGEPTNEAIDGGHLPGIVDEVRKLREELGKEEEALAKIAADRGYFSVGNIEEEGKGIELLIASGREGEDEFQGDTAYSLERFGCVKDSDSWRCPDWRFLVREEKQAGRGRPLLRRYQCRNCEGCRLRSGCLRVGEERRTLLVKRKQSIRAEMRARLKEPDKHVIYRKRKWLAGQNIRQAKGSLGFRPMTVRGEVYVRAQWLFALAAHNVLKAMSFIALQEDEKRLWRQVDKDDSSFRQVCTGLSPIALDEKSENLIPSPGQRGQCLSFFSTR